MTGKRSQNRRQKAPRRERPSQQQRPFRLGRVFLIGAGAAVVIVGITVAFIPPGADEPTAANLAAAAKPVARIEDDPSTDGWDTELFHQAVEAQLQELKPLLFASSLEAAQLQPFVMPGFSCSRLRPDESGRASSSGRFGWDRCC